MDNKPIKDPHYKPIELRTETEEGKKKLGELGNLLFPGVDLSEATVLFTTPTKYPKSVIDSLPMASCQRCKQEVWISPSSMRILQNTTIVCLDCLTECLEKLDDKENSKGPRG